MNEKTMTSSKKELIIKIITFVFLAFLYSAAAFTAWAVHAVIRTDYIGFFMVLFPLAVDILLSFKTKNKSYILMLSSIVPVILSIIFLFTTNFNSDIYKIILFSLWGLSVRVFSENIFLIKNKKLKLIPIYCIITIVLAVTIFFAYDKSTEIREYFKVENEPYEVAEDKRLRDFVFDIASDIDKFFKKAS